MKSQRNRTPRSGCGAARRRTASIVLVAAAGLVACGTTRPPVSIAPWPAGPGTVDVYAAGDIADCAHGGPRENMASRTAELVPGDSVVLGLGDMAYPLATESELASCFEPSWGAHRDRILAVPGNHDYVNGDAKAFREYFRIPATDSRFVAYTAELAPGWLFIALDSNVRGESLQRELDWLRQALEASPPSRCIVAAWHTPVFSSGLHRGAGEHMRPFWQLLDEHGADVILNGHEHFYEAYGPHSAAGVAMPDGEGPREFTVGTGGARLYGFWRPPYASRARALTHGVLRLALQADRYAWAFVDVNGHVQDAGAAPCRAKVPSTLLSTP